MRIQTMTTAVFLVNLLYAGANAGVIQISNNTNDSFLLYSHSLGNLFGSDVSPAFSTDQLASVHSALLAWGIDTDGKITILPVDTNHGLSFLTLVDQEFGGGDGGIDGILGVSSTGPSTMGFFINDDSGDTWNLIESPWFTSQTLGATFGWGSVDSGDAFAWTDLVVGDAVSYAFEDLDGVGGAIDSEAFQFVGWNNNSWEIVSTNGFKIDSSSVFTGTVVPTPPAVLLLVATIFSRRKRRPAL